MLMYLCYSYIQRCSHNIPKRESHIAAGSTVEEQKDGATSAMWKWFVNAAFTEKGVEALYTTYYII